MTTDKIWVLKALLKIIVEALVAIMVYRIWYWMDNCVVNRKFAYPPVYKCGIHPFNFTNNYIEMREHNQEMSEGVKGRAKIEDFPPY